MTYRFFNPVNIEMGSHILVPALKRIIGNQRGRIGLFYGKRAMKQSGVIDAINKALSDCRIIEWDMIESNPDAADINRMLSGFDEGLDWLIGIGGGSVLDAAKAVAFLLHQRSDIWSALKGDMADLKRNIPYIAVPTTSGTGSEVTPWATVWDNTGGKKYSLSHRLMFPMHAIVDPVLTLTCPARITAETGFDALSHAFEAFWSRHANPVSDALAINAIAAVFRYLPDVMKDLGNLDSRTKLSLASLNAGLAFSNTKTTAVHALSYPMTLEFGLSHGLACSLLLGEFLLFNKEHIDKQKVNRLLKTLDCNTIEEVKQGMDALKRKAGIPISLKEANVPKSGIEWILDNGFHPERVTNNPKPVSRQAAKTILERIAD